MKNVRAIVYALLLVAVLLTMVMLPCYGSESTFFGPKKYNATSGKTVTSTNTFSSSTTGSQFTLRIINGEGDDDEDDHNISGVTITLNGQQIFKDSDFEDSLIERQVSLISSNKLVVSINGDTGSYITVSIVGQNNNVTTPNVVGMTQANAQSAILAANLRVGTIATANSSTVPSGSVISQSPASGSNVATGSTVALTISQGSSTVSVPNVVGMTQTNAQTAILAANLTIGTITNAYSSTVPSGSVISQNPASGASVAQGSAVALTVSQGPAPVSVPNVVGMSQANAQAAITAAMLVAGNITTTSSSTVAAGSVISQTPTSGTLVSQGTAVALVISSGPPTVSVPNVVGMTQTNAQVAISAAMLAFGNITTASSNSVPTGNIISQNPAANAFVAQGTEVAFVLSSGPAPIVIPPDPATVAPATDATVATTVAGSTAFLYSGSNTIQMGVAAGTIQVNRAAVLRGQVNARDGQPLSGVVVSILNHPEFGQTVTRTDGMFDMAVNGGGYLTVTYEKAGYLSAQRQINAPWQDFAWLPVVILIPIDAQMTTINLASSSQPQIHRGGVVTDTDGTRQATLLFSSGTTAQMVMPDGSTQPVASLNIRATEYTVGPNGPKTMPGQLPPASGYTYAVELSGDEAIAANAKQIKFTQPVHVYVDNFIGFPVGETVPSGYYDRGTGQWIASQNGRVINILSITGGLADIDTNGDGLVDDATTLAILAITPAEQQQLAILYPQTPKQLWRVPVTHFSSWDFNWPTGPPPNAAAPNQPEPEVLKPTQYPCEKGGSIIECQNQVLGERLSITGTPFTLNYRSSRVPGHKTDYTVNIPVSGANVPASLKRIELTIQVAGRQFSRSFPASSNQSYAFTWDGKDAYGRSVQGKQPLTVKIGYIYGLVYLSAKPGPGYDEAFGHFTYYGSPVTASQEMREVTLWQSMQLSIGSLVFDARSQGVGGWDLDIHHVYDPVGKMLLFGDGSWRSSDSLGAMIMTTVAGNGTQGYYGGDGGLAINASLYIWGGLAIGPDGSIYIADTDNNRVRRVSPDGIITTVAGYGHRYFSGDGGPATSAALSSPYGVAIGPDGGIYIADMGNNRIRRVGPDGIITTVAGNGNSGNSGDGGPATSAAVNFPSSVAVGPDGSIYIPDLNGSNRIRRVGPDGIITTVVGNGNYGYSGDGGPATSASLYNPNSVAVGQDGSIYIVDQMNRRIRRVGPDGIITTVAGNGNNGYSGDGGPATSASLYNPNSVAVGQDGSIYVSDLGNLRIRRVGTDGIITSIAGNGTRGYRGDGGPATSASFYNPTGVAVGPAGNIYIADAISERIRLVSPGWPGVSISDISVPSEDGSQIYIFNGSGKHLRTLNALTSATLFSFNYDTSGLLVTITDGSGNITTIERDANSNPTAIVAPFGQRTDLTLDANGYLASVTNPAQESTQMTYYVGGLMNTYTDPKKNIHNFTYDANGLLTLDENPASGYTTLAGTNTSTSKQQILTTALGRTTTYLTEYIPTGDQRQTITTPTGGQSVTLLKTDGSQQATMSDGMTSLVTLGTDPRFGALVYVPASTTIKTPAGLTMTLARTRMVSFADPATPVSLTSQTDTITVNGRAYSSLFDATQNISTTSTPAGRTLVALTDSLGRPLSIRLDPAIAPITFSYDTRGRLYQTAQGNQQVTYGYDLLGRLASRSDIRERTTTYGYDNADRLNLLTLPSKRKYVFDYDANGNRTQITMPNGAVHTLGHTTINLGNSYTPPENLPYTWEYSLDQEWRQTILPGGRIVDSAYEEVGARHLGIVYPEATVSLNYSDLTDRVRHIIRTPAGGGTAQMLSLTYDGNLVTGQTYSGSANGQFVYTYDNNFFLNQITLTSGTDTVVTPIIRDIDADGLVTGYGSFTYNRTGPAGAVKVISDGTLNVAITYDPSGRLSSRTHTVNGTTIYAIQLEYDERGNIDHKTETLNGTSTTWIYGYDEDGQLTTSSINGVAVEVHLYDENGNRTDYTSQWSSWPVSATYDRQDRLQQQGGVAYQFNADGQLTQRGTDTFQYSARGELLQATVPNLSATPITYAYDGMHRRIAKTDSSGTYQYLYGNLKSPFQLTAMRDPAGILSMFYYSEAGALFAMDKGSTRYYVASDQLGSPRVVSDAAGAVVKTQEYDSFGMPRYDGDPELQMPVGFAGGITDDTTGLVRFGYRDYDPDTGRWTAKDPIFFGGGQGNLYQYVQNNPVNWIDPTGLWTFGIGLSSNGQLGPFNGNWSIGFVVDGYGNLGWYNTVGGGVGVGADGSVGLQFSGSNGDCIKDLAGPFGNTSASLGAGLSGTVEGFSGPGSQGQTVVGGGFTVGAGAGAGWSVGGSQTWVHSISSLW